MVKIAFMGAPCSHKTTQWARLWSDLKLDPKVYDVIGLAESARECPFPLNVPSLRANLWMSMRQIELEEAVKDCPVVLCDRTVLDQAIFMRAWGAKPEELEFIESMALAYYKLNPYDLIFFLRPMPLKLDSKRQISQDQQMRVDRITQEFLSRHCADRVIEIDGQNDEEKYAYILAMSKVCIEKGRVEFAE